MSRRKNTGQRAQVLAVLEEGPTTTTEMRLATGLPLKHCSAYLTALVREGKVEVFGRKPREHCPHCGHKPPGQDPIIYALKAQRVAA